MSNSKSTEKSDAAWNILINETQEKLDDAKFKVGELTKALAIFRARRDAGDPCPSTQN